MDTGMMTHTRAASREKRKKEFFLDCDHLLMGGWQVYWTM